MNVRLLPSTPLRRPLSLLPPLYRDEPISTNGVTLRRHSFTLSRHDHPRYGAEHVAAPAGLSRFDFFFGSSFPLNELALTDSDTQRP